MVASSKSAVFVGEIPCAYSAALDVAAVELPGGLGPIART